MRASRVSCLFAALLLLTSVAGAYVPDDRWTTTASGAAGVEGTPLTLTWSIVPDGTDTSGAGSSDLIAYFDDLFDESATGSDLTSRTWFSLLQQSFDRLEQLSGVSFVYEENDSGQDLATARGVLGVLGDIRIGGGYVDGASGTLAYTYLPNNGDMVIDTGETTFYSDATNNYRQFRNTVMHEVVHALGLLHVESSTEDFLLEPYINTSFDGPQLDDVRGLHGLYGDANEKANSGQGNDIASHATDLGALAGGQTLAVGSDAVGDQSVAADETDFISISHDGDADYYSFTVDGPSLLDITLTPLGGVFYQAVEGGPESLFDANSRNDLTLSLFESDGATLLESSSLGGLGEAESIAGLLVESAGEYLVRVTGDSSSVQLYELQLAATAALLSFAGDYNNDGVVDQADYLVWRDNYGASAAGVSVVQQAPEPGAALLSAAVMAALAMGPARCRAAAPRG